MLGLLQFHLETPDHCFGGQEVGRRRIKELVERLTRLIQGSLGLVHRSLGSQPQTLGRFEKIIKCFACVLHGQLGFRHDGYRLTEFQIAGRLADLGKSAIGFAESDFRLCHSASQRSHRSLVEHGDHITRCDPVAL